ncbi:transcription elongation factor GreA [Desulfovibrio litoralis]|uniref:Transcription elongation factor GreA n=1 Tax=Desulfovibrio litoralis DSM 11393 TaxID=1121455 RepID=A0A1M7TEU8_9BACT|nr:transcription elongation factor GreA [Desulfovibrio litoralis]SHN69178.1 transcription elongation factor GreA [Desulfovibrio litoralis DSM 11393]
MSSIPISIQGFERTKIELERLKAERPGVIQAIKEAKEEGDLSENAGYDAARERQGMLEAKIRYIESRMPQFNVLDLANIQSDQVIYGATIKIEDLDSGEVKEYLLLGPDETDYVSGSISVFSPVGLALLGKYEGDEVIVDAPRGRINYEIISLAYNGVPKFKDLD